MSYFLERLCLFKEFIVTSLVSNKYNNLQVTIQLETFPFRNQEHPSATDSFFEHFPTCTTYLNVAADHVHPFMETVFFLGFFHSSIIIMPDWYEFNPIYHINGEKTIIHRERVDLQRRADLSGNKVYHIRNERRRNSVNIIWIYLVHCEKLVYGTDEATCYLERSPAPV